MRGVSLDEIAAATRIKTSFLEALESGRWDELPGGAFNRGFIRATSRFLGLDEDGMVDEYALETGSAARNRPVAEPSGGMPRDYRPAAMAIAVAVLVVIAGGWFGYREYSVHRQKRKAAPAASASANSTTSAARVADNAGSAATDAAKETTDAKADDSQPAAAGASATAVDPAASGTLKLKVAVSKRTEIKVIGDGKTLFKGHIRSDAPRVFEARDGFEVTAGDASVVQLELNGQNVPFLSVTGRQGRLSLGRKDLKAQGAAPH